MDILFPRCAGLDVHKDMVVACARIVREKGVDQQVRTFAATTGGLLQLSEWLAEQDCTHVAMEATGVYWKPVWHVLEGAFQLVLANAMHIRNMPGRKTDVNDAMWIADLLAHGLIRGSFVPPAPIQELRGLTRTRKQLVRERAQHVLRIQKTLEDANLKITGLISDVVGVSGRAILQALIAGETNPAALADLTVRLKASRDELIAALTGRVTAHHRFLLKLHLDLVNQLQRSIDTIDKQLGAALKPFCARADCLTEIPGISAIAAPVVIAEIGIDMSRFPTVGHLISWAGFCPQNDQSAGKRRSNRLRKGAPWLKTVLVQCAWAAVRVKESYLRAQFLRIKSRRGPKKAIVAVAASILTAIYYMLRDGVAYRDLGADYFERRDQAKTLSRLVKRIERLGYHVAVEPAAPAA